VPAKKPAPDIYLLALERLGVPADRAVAVEDSGGGLRAALAAGVTCVVTVNGYTAGDDMRGAALVVDSFGEPGAPPVRVLADEAGVSPGAYLTLADLAAALPAAEHRRPPT
jgi:beta-phosphoglucomutase-like phosphatase (HAD superfamily)